MNRWVNQEEALPNSSEVAEKLPQQGRKHHRKFCATAAPQKPFAQQRSNLLIENNQILLLPNSEPN